MVEGTLRVARACLANGVERLIYVSSTAALYLGHDCGREVVDDDVGPDPRPEERALYARGKVAAENALRALARESRLPVTIVRPAVVVGPGAPLQHSGLGLWVRDNHCVGWGRGERPVPLVLVDDVADALARLSEHEGHDLDGRAHNLAARTPLSAAQVVRAYAERTGRAFTFHPRSLALSQTLEIGKWLVKRAGGRADAPFPSYRDLKSRELWPVLSCRTARDVLGWRPCEDPDEILERSLRTTGGAP
jgi:nucleoside-diphosphate-sugar epimerase